MIRTEQIQTYRYTKEANDSGGFEPGVPELMTLAPTWATIVQNSGDDIEISKRKATESRFTVTVNFPLNGFRYDDTMFITSRFGNLDIIGISQSPTRKRDYTLQAIRIEGVTGTGGGQIMVDYTQATPGTDEITIPILQGKTILLAFREGIGKQVVEVTPFKPEQMKYTGTGYSLYPGDKFGDELITTLYKT